MMQDLTKYKSPTYQFQSWLGTTRKIHLTLEQGRTGLNVIANTSDFDGNSNNNRSLWTSFVLLDDTPLDECWERCLTTFKEYYDKPVAQV